MLIDAYVVVQIGEVTGTGSGGVVDGKAYDMVIPVEIELPSGLRKLEIGYNQGENPFSVAQQFIDKHMLDQTYLREIADYITQRAGEYRPPVLGNSDDAQSVPSTTVANEPSAAAARFKYFPVVRIVDVSNNNMKRLLSVNMLTAIDQRKPSTLR